MNLQSSVTSSIYNQPNQQARSLKAGEGMAKRKIMYHHPVSNTVATFFSVVRKEFGRDDKGFYVEQRDFVPNDGNKMQFNGQPVDYTQPTRKHDWFPTEQEAQQALDASGLPQNWPVHLFRGPNNKPRGGTPERIAYDATH